MKKWKCTVCDQVFEGLTAPSVCPVCGASHDAFIEVEVAAQNIFTDSDRRFVIIGTGAAAVSCAKAIRQRDRTCSITLVGNEEVFPYNRPSLSDVVAGQVEFIDTFMEKADFYQTHHLTLRCGETVERIDAAGKKVFLAGGDVLPYDSLCLATGAYPFNPIKPAEGAIPVQTLRTYEDALTLASLPQGSHVVVVGGGILGVEAAIALRERGHNVTLVELAERILALQGDAKASKTLTEALERNGVTVMTGRTVSEVKQGGVVLTDGTELSASHVLVSIGVRSNMTLASAAGLTIGRGIQVDEHMRTSSASIFASGDCAEYNGRVAGLWNAAIAQGEIAGANMAGDELVYRPPVSSLAFNELGLRLFSAGMVNQPGGAKLVWEDPLNHNYRLLVFDNGRLCGTLFMGNTQGAATAIQLIDQGASPKEAQRLLLGD
ncbi:MAG: FAD-dependent oxidoreductase [Clostridia bacterium]|nr:FAD-dependent oxidoreductase [Clostridia bacterium]